MKASATAVLAAALAMFPLCAMGSKSSAAEPMVLVTIKPVHSLAAAVMQGAGSPILLLDGAASPHAYALKPSQARQLQNAGLVVRVSEGLETFLVKPIAGLPKRVQVATLDRIDGLKLHPFRTGTALEADPHDHAGHGQGHKAAGIDPHLWLDPDNARRIGMHLAEVLGRLAPEHASRYRANAAALGTRLDQLASRLAIELKPFAERRFLVFHDAYQYLERRFGVVAAGAVTVNPEVPPSAKRISALRARVAKGGIVCVFAEPQFPPKVIDTIIEGTKAARGTLDPLGADLAAGPDQYFMLMEGLARDLSACLGRAA
ncbi:MAG: zinc ABC transporter substrate-binding protein [Hyphomicrobiaceae bacterium]|nr:zinc ABC transporter substrate-binding protein [Hyphomicrobiaceae bacterium]